MPFDALKSAGKTFKDRDLSSSAAALTYFSILSIFPAMIAVISLLGVIGESAIQPIIDQVESAAPGPGRELLVESLTSIAANREASVTGLVIGVLLAVWSASGYVGGFMDVENAIYATEEERPYWKKYATRYLLTATLLFLLAICGIGLVFTGNLAGEVGDIIGMGSQAVGVWTVLKYPILLVAMSLMLALLYWFAPDVRHPSFLAIVPGSGLAILFWIAASLLFGVYVSEFASYNKTYGALGGIVMFLVWLWITNIAVLFGATLNAQVEARRGGEVVPEETVIARSRSA
ncbi:MAG: YihY/virulence factor BrkB family protein [Solirubrobacterales bacterium]|nr:YihY/virulence factor BrkB family protein [Solirubrobacterales bacterium]